jgi:hypothetical protein
MERAHQPARRDVQPEAVVEQRRDLPERHPELFIEAHGQGHGVRAQLHGGGAERVGRLQAMSTLHASLTATTPSDVDIKAPHDRLHRWQIFLILRRHVRLPHLIATGRARRGHRHIMRLMHDGGHRPLAVPTVSGARLAPWPSWPTFRRALRERRGLARPRPARGLQFVLQTRVLAFQPCPLTLDSRPLRLRPLEFTPQLRILPAQFVDPFRRFPIVGATTHAPVMPESSRQYKSDPVTEYL